MNKPRTLPILLLDVDGTLADWSRRAKDAGIEPSRQDSEEHAAWINRVQNDESLAEDPPVPLMAFLVQRLASQMRVVYLTARHSKHREVTVNWLQRNGFPNGDLFMRAEGDYRETYKFKEDCINQVINSLGIRKILAIDDDPSADMSVVYRAYDIVHLKPTFCMFDLETGGVMPAYGGVVEEVSKSLPEEGYLEKKEEEVA